MWVSDSLKMVFIQHPGMGGKSMASAMKCNKDRILVGDRHSTITEGIEAAGERWDKWKHYRRIGIVRHPIEFLDSAYFYRGVPTEVCPLWGCTNRKTLTKMSVLEYVDQFKDTPFDYYTHEGEVIVDEIIKLENLDSFFKENDMPIRHRGHNSEERIQLQYTKESLELIRKKYHRELAYYPERPIEVSGGN